ncbi:family 10 glycosylhydrolase [Clostridium sp. Ade.TY]|uniref:glycoside hydrolase family 10 protein n=1 Tax=Clostridium sp. Ade.TY TaxID=1391647 RepID=UPI000408C45A|nr:family 10 glycosylhydrolase [Clostridium sp. Ade.TY]
MIKRKFILLSTVLAALMGGQTILASASNIKEDPLFKYGTNEPILLHGEQITVPTKFQNKKEDFRATWLSTVSNIDFPKVANESEFRAEFTKVVKKAKELGLNALIFQVRPMLDAWYQSSINPSSEFIDGKQGGKLSFDPLKIAIQLAHEEGLELHAWFNPYRVTNKATDYRKKEDKLKELDDMNFAKKNPDLVYEFANKLYLDPGRPEVLDHIVNTIEEVLNNYDVDAIHFDDYFYPYKTTFKKVLGYDENGKPIVDTNNTTMAMRDSDVDSDTFENYNRGFDNIHKWREDNINLLIKEVKETVSDYNNKTKNSVQFGVSPFGIWGHAEEIEGGSHTPTTSTASINDYVNTRKWVKEEMLDYLIPQIYWQFNQPAAPYGELVDWWNEQFEGVEKTQLYVGHPNYKIIENSAKDFDNPDEIPAQLRFNQKYDNVKGSVFFSYNKLNVKSNTKMLSQYSLIDPRFNLDNKTKNVDLVNREDVNKKTTETIKEYYNISAKTPAKPWLDHAKTSAVNGLNGKNKNGEINLRWNDKNSDTRFYQVYRVEGKVKTIDQNNFDNVIARFGNENGTEFKDNTIDSKKTYTYGVTIIDKAGNESNINTFTVNGKK